MQNTLPDFPIQTTQATPLLNGRQTHDTSTQAMTEVALGLSMAFFAILIVALLSMGNPSSAQAPLDDKLQASAIIESTTFELEQAPSDDNQADNTGNNHTIILYWQGTYYNLKQEVVSKSAITQLASASQNHIIIAISNDTSFKELQEIQNAFLPSKVSLSSLDIEWQVALSGTER
ncbi:MAG: hypothetical protein WA981_16190 [Glaciecola sp.]